MPTKAKDVQIGQYGEFGKNLNISTYITQHSYQITSQMRWPPLAPEKTFLQLKKA